MMQTIPIVIIATLVAMLVWTVHQRGDITTLTRQNQELEQIIHTHQRADSKQAKHTEIRTSLDDTPINWTKVVKDLRSNLGGYGYLKTTRRLDEAFESMSYDGLITALDEIHATDLSKGDRQMLIRIMCSQLFSRFTEQSLARFIDRYREPIWQHSIAQGFAKWIRQHPEKATTWYESELLTGTFNTDSPENQLNTPETLLEYGIYSILSSSPDHAQRLLASVPQSSQLRALSSIRLTNLTPEDHINWATLVRNTLCQKDQLKAITWPTQNWSDGDGAPMHISEVDAYLRRIQPNNDELEACIMTVAAQPTSWQQDRRKIKTDDIDRLRQWVNTHQPELLDTATAKAVRSAHIPYQELERIISRYHATSHNDELLIALLKNRQASHHRELSRDIASRLTDEAQRNHYLDEFE
ncbi:hypothetical protein HW115_09045 [Verrucomicrobiaceae bacterium N1E253]|uniref:Uncharacterized protein n=1 Tax=Oceaniferula marina TaxID=2748318 RepID=A0A851GKQ5_9BACT|nr:hypothetical protein [Oceaniferula marina]NWK55755.1 hypothetical protein [Oceaniferula marina]